jgi:alanyl-tRNA synthetase
MGIVMNSNEIRQSFLDFFKGKQHHIVPSAPVIPQNDPTLLFTNAGMNQFKDIFLGTRERPYPRVADSQKCIRVSGKHNDLEEVGRDTYHHTFFEMLGNWSFADYFKAEAIEWAWELLTNVWQLPKDRLYATVFSGDKEDHVPFDKEAADLWREVTDIPPDHILPFGKKDNFWEMGQVGPCGPCSEIHIDIGPEYENKSDASKSGVNSGSSRYIEIWNLVFIQYNRDLSGKLHQLPYQHVDTGAGFERLVAVLQNKGSNYDTDLFKPLMDTISSLTGYHYGQGGEIDVAFRVLSDHIRALSFAIADGAIPGNEGQGYVLRRLLRRAARFGRILNIKEPFFFHLVDPLVDKMGHAYPEIKERQKHITRVIKAEEESFNRTLDRGIELFEEIAQKIRKKGETAFPGKDAFLLHDTYGFPLDLTQLMAQERGLNVDSDGFNREMNLQRQRSSGVKQSEYETLDLELLAGKKTEFVGYTLDEVESHVEYADDQRIILSSTPLYAEAGGQVGDRGTIFNDKIQFVVDTTKPIGQYIVHHGKYKEGVPPAQGTKVIAKVDSESRRPTERNHTVTHLLHKSLRKILGDHISQAGSLVHPDYMRFDFTHFEKISRKDLEQIEQMVNEHILRDLPVSWRYLKLDEAKKMGAVALFGEKYGDIVRMVQVDSFSRELCGGTHVDATGKIGAFVITSESAVAAGIRRIEALTGLNAMAYMKKRVEMLSEAAQLVGAAPEKVPSRIKAFLSERKELENQIKSLQQKGASDIIGNLVTKSQPIDGINVVCALVDVPNMDGLKTMGDQLRDRLKSGVGILGADLEGKAALVCVVTKDLIETKGLKAGDIIKKVARIAGGGGGGSPHMATAGAKDTTHLQTAIESSVDIVKDLLD